MKNRVVASIEARTNASRLPGKVLQDLGGIPALSQMLNRVRQSKTLHDVVIATTDNAVDDVIEKWAIEQDVPCFRGSENDVLDRVLKAHQMMKADTIVELCGDCPLLEAQVIDDAVALYLEGRADLVSTVISPSLPAGIDVEVFSLKNLEWVAQNITDLSVREHVSSYFYEHPEKYRLQNLTAPAQWAFPEIRLLLDYPEDLLFLQAVFEHFHHRNRQEFSLDDVLILLEEDPIIGQLQKDCIRKAAA